MASYINNHTAPLTIGTRTVQPGEAIDLTADEVKFSGVQAFTADGWLAEDKKPEPKGKGE